MFFPAGLDRAAAQQILAAEHVDYDFGADLLDSSDNVVDDLTGDLQSFSIERDCYRTIHATITLVISRELVWGSDRVRPWMRCTSRHGSFTVPLGVFLTSVPESQAGESPRTYTVSGFDKILTLDSPYGQTIGITNGYGYLDFATARLQDAGQNRYLVDTAQSGAQHSGGNYLWPVGDQSTYLAIVDWCLERIAYQDLWADPEGVLRLDSYVPLDQRADEWTYDDGQLSTLGAERSSLADYTDVPNRWIFICDDPTVPDSSGGTQPPTYRLDNVSDGPTSQNARGFIKTRIVHLQPYSYDSLVALGNRMAAEDQLVVTTAQVSVAPNPLHSHFDVVQVSDNDLGLSGRWLVTGWSLEAAKDGPPPDMKLTLRRIGD